MAETGHDINKARSILESGDLVAIPTETVYGLAGNALDDEALLKIYKVKNRPKFDPLIAHTDSIEKVKSYVDHIPDKAMVLAEAYWPGPLTLLLRKKKHLPDLLTSGLPTVAIRMPRHDLTLQLLKTLEFPLAAPSANPFGYVSPTTAQHVEDQLGQKILYILDGGKCKVGIESTIIGFDEQEHPIIYRLGGKDMEAIEKLVGRVRLRVNHSSDPLVPGMLKSHYATHTRLVVGRLTDLIPRYANKKFGIISFSLLYKEIPKENQIVLSSTRNLDEAARHLFSAMRTMDSRNFDYILTERFPDQGLGKAINDRLHRAAAR